MSASRSASANFADASINMLPDLPAPPPGKRWAAAPCGGNYHLIDDPDSDVQRPQKAQT